MSTGAWVGIGLAVAALVWFLFLRPAPAALPLAAGDVAPDDPVPANGADDRKPRFSFSFEI